jgi:hypothetical protein
MWWFPFNFASVLYIQVSAIDLRFGRFPIDRDATQGLSAGARNYMSVKHGHIILLPYDILSVEVAPPLDWLFRGYGIWGSTYYYTVPRVTGNVRIRARGTQYRLSSNEPETLAASIERMLDRDALRD